MRGLLALREERLQVTEDSLEVFQLREGALYRAQVLNQSFLFVHAWQGERRKERKNGKRTGNATSVFLSPPFLLTNTPR